LVEGILVFEIKISENKLFYFIYQFDWYRDGIKKSVEKIWEKLNDEKKLKKPYVQNSDIGILKKIFFEKRNL